ncbi:MAG: DEAD/DEAH box helicase [Chloroflexi bacterium]|nr:DEAD/DEAH box helicase [Chloroflexota bacterium]
MDCRAFLHHLIGLSDYRGQVAHVEYLPPREAIHGEVEPPLMPAVEVALRERGMLPLYSHQAAAVNALHGGANVMVATPSASGKTLCYNIPVMETLLKGTDDLALYLFPTKALAQDQLRSLSKLMPTIKAATFDGDTPTEERGWIRRSAQVVITNPDMLHLGILPHHRLWSRFFKRLRYVVVDEAHVYRGAFGSHVAQTLRRMRRLCSHYGSRPQFIACSATIANPKEHIQNLVGLPFQVVDEDGAPFPGKYFVFWNPPFLDRGRMARRSPNTEASSLFTELVVAGWRTLTFARTRRLAELIYIYTRNALRERAPELAEHIKPYRAGYLPQERRRIEQELFQGRLVGAATTSALELGVDIGQLGATVLAGYPGSVASTWQQAGRSGRGQDESLSFLIATDNPLDQYFMRHPEAFLGRSHEHALIDITNLHILKPHLLCAAHEMPLVEADSEVFGTAFHQARAELEEGGLVNRRGGRWHLSPRIFYPAREVNLRSISAQSYTILDTSQGNQVLETVEDSVAFSQIHCGAIYLHQGEAYIITRLDLSTRTAYAAPTDQPYYTQAREIVDLRIEDVLQEKKQGSVAAKMGHVMVTTTVVGFKKKHQISEEVLGDEPLDLPPQSFSTVALWFDIPPDTAKRIKDAGLDLAGGLHAAEHAAIGVLPLFALCDRRDMGGLSTLLHPDTGQPQIFIYDAYPGGIGIAEKGYHLLEELWRVTLQTVAECSCDDGCPSCVQSPKCGNNNEPLDKRAAQEILAALLGIADSPSSPPMAGAQAAGLRAKGN